MERSIWFNGKEVLLTEMISGQFVTKDRIQKPDLAEEIPEEVKLNRLVAILEVNLINRPREGNFGAGGYRFYN